MEKAADLLDLPSKHPIRLVNPYEDVDDKTFPQASYFGGDGKDLPIDVERAKIKKIIPESISKVQFINKSQKEKLKSMCINNIAAFGLTQGTGQVSDLTPVPCHLAPDAPPGISVKPRPVGQKEETWLKNRIEELVAANILKRVEDSIYSVPIHIVPKKSEDPNKQYRLVVDMRRVNDFTIRTSLQPPHLEQQLQRTRHAIYYGAVDIMSGFDYLPIREDAKRFFNMATPWGAAYQFQGTVQGWKNSPLYFQDRIFREILEGSGFMEPDSISRGLVQWVDDVLLYSRDFDAYVDMMDKVLKRFIKKKVRLNVKKCIFISQKLKYCGKYLEKGTAAYEPELYTSILKTKRPTYQHQLAGILYVCNWLGPTIYNLNEFRTKFSKAVRLGMKQSKLKRLKLPIAWTDDLIKVWDLFLLEISNAMRRNLSMYDPDRRLNIFTDSSEIHWSSLMTQTDIEEDALHIMKKKHYPVLLLNGSFAVGQIKWHISQKEIFPISKLLKRVDYLILGHPNPVRVYTDHRNLIYLIKSNWNENKSALGSYPSRREFNIFHIKGELNVLADIVSRWGNPNYEEPPNKTIQLNAYNLRKKKKKNYNNSADDEESSESLQEYLKKMDQDRLSFLNPYYKGGWKRINEQELLSLQRKLEPTLTILKKVNDKIFIPLSLVQRLIVHNHIALGHPSQTLKLNELNKYYYFELPYGIKLEDLIKELHRQCIHCVRVPSLIRTPHHSTDLGEKRGDVLRLEILYISNEGYILVLLDNATRKISLTYCKKCTAMDVVKSLLVWHSWLELRPTFTSITDRGSHFCNILLQELSQWLRYTHSFAISYAPWTNGGIEDSNVRILLILRSITDELHLSQNQWKETLPYIQSTTNMSRSTRNKNYTPNELFLGLTKQEVDTDEDFLIKRHLFKAEGGSKPLQRARNPDVIIQESKKLANFIDEKQNMVYSFVKMPRKNTNDRYNAKFAKGIIQYNLGDWVLTSSANTHRARLKYKLKWQGPLQVVDTISDNVYKLKSLLGKEMVCHASRMWWYEPPEYEPSEEIMKHFRRTYGALSVEGIYDIKLTPEGHYLKTKWLGFEEKDYTFEPLEILASDVPNLVKDFLSEGGGLKKQLRKGAFDMVPGILNNDNEAVHLNAIRCFAKTPSEAKTWLPIEKIILKQCIAAYGVGNYKSIHDNAHLPYKNTK
eukprot:snap_masked-scaffold_3-processed-gene-1.14-mRNA-1 protein AED:1.00 eAED:1.00 QI:0/0/0/0/1/1/2/0/1179